MSSVLATIMGVFSYILAGYILKRINIIPANIEKIFSSISFNVLLPLALIVNFWLITFPNVFVIKLIVSFFGAGIIVFIVSFYISKQFYRFKVDDSALFGLGACFGNSVALGIPLMYSILGPIDAMPYMILVLFHGIIHFTYTTLIIESYRNRKQSNINKIIKTIFGLVQNIVLVGMFIGLALNYLEIPFPNNLQNILQPIAIYDDSYSTSNLPEDFYKKKNQSFNNHKKLYQLINKNLQIKEYIDLNLSNLKIEETMFVDLAHYSSEFNEEIARQIALKLNFDN